MNISQAAIDVLAERQRQVGREGWSTAHDDSHASSEMTFAAISYAFRSTSKGAARATPPSTWPWSRAWWKPGAARRMLVKAAALLIAEIERLDRASAAGA